ncbi:hypothetical protein [Pseudomonas gingeri]|uniref:Uncharacterized protein n=1 Tax=Pseudomonas gingeri TaxID=117681 RepID=A0A7Y7Y6V7_9PSED|nr:hypothetical protein [Pseudomonas gingeri]NWA04105.1 hypothetical protein [Pseudomonas gingeri]NWA15949.1 hypothetical protein [Pseudomonas gingeri]NWA58315.1 hypothetical protein [Pseudomonas gingeri]NWA99333.1 hypothetical protein [Pseudomonas gingeri]NWB05882.1 hypothetical protein [Pseudomonas gingeri]
MSQDLNQYRYFQRSPRPAGHSGRTSCLTINQPGARLALNNLLDLISHEIRQEDDEKVHRLTFKSGQTLCITIDASLITVRGSRVDFHTDSRYPHTTYLEDPSLISTSNKLSL